MLFTYKGGIGDSSNTSLKHAESCGKEQWLKGYIKGESGGMVTGEFTGDVENGDNCKEDFTSKVPSPGGGP